MKGLQFRIDGIFRIIMDLCFYGVTFLFFELVFLHTSTFGGLVPWQMRIFVASYLLVDSLRMALFVDNFDDLRHLVAKGGFDYYLIRPVSSLFLVSFKDVNPASLFNVFVAGSLLLTTLVIAPEKYSFFSYLLFAILLLNGLLVFYLLHLFTSIIVFWTGSPDGLEPLFYIGKRFAERPHSIYSPLIRGVLLTVIPYGLIASVPTEAILSVKTIHQATQFLLTSLSVTVVGCFICRWLWCLALKNYSSASS
jgi:ABC-2 type transport system permease protein